MSESPAAGASLPLLDGIRRHLEGLKRTADGRALYELIERGLQRYGSTSHGLERAFVTFLYSLLGRYAKDPQYDPATRIKARLIQQRLKLHLANTPREHEAAVAPERGQRATRTEPGDEERQRQVEPTELGRSSELESDMARAAASAEIPTTQLGSLAPTHEPPAVPGDASPSSETPVAAEDTIELAGVSEAAAVPATAVAAHSAAPVAQDVAPLEDELAGHLLDTLTATPAAAGEGTGAEPLRDFGALRQILVEGIDGLIREREALLQKINHTAEYLKSVDSERRRLAEELRKTRAHSLLDELTGLPRREVFLRSLEAEIGRVRRYGFAFALALVDIDGLGAFNARYGRAAGDGVLRCYAQEIFSRFRAYDLVARYGDDEFAILFPNTQKEGAVRALEKARKHVAATYLQHEGKSLPLPGFSSVLTMYLQGEKPQALLARAAEALDQARLKGRDQLVVALPTH